MFKSKKKDVLPVTDQYITKELLRFEDGEVIDAGVVYSNKTTEKDSLFEKKQKPNLMKRLKNVDKDKALTIGKRAFWTCLILLTAIVLFNTLSFIQSQKDSNGNPESPITPNQVETTVPMIDNREKEPNPPEKTEVEISDWPDLISHVKQTNQSLIVITESDFETIESYQNRELNRKTLQVKLSKSLALKEDILSSLIVHKETFYKHDLVEFYEQTIQRATESVSLSKKQVSLALEYKDHWNVLQDSYLGIDTSIETKQREKLIEFLDSKKVSYTVEPSTNEIQF